MGIHRTDTGHAKFEATKVAHAKARIGRHQVWLVQGRAKSGDQP